MLADTDYSSENRQVPCLSLISQIANCLTYTVLFSERVIKPQSSELLNKM